MSDLSNIVEELVEKRFRELIVKIVEGDYDEGRESLRGKLAKMVFEAINEELSKRKEEIKTRSVEEFKTWFDGMELRFWSQDTVGFSNPKAKNKYCM